MKTPFFLFSVERSRRSTEVNLRANQIAVMALEKAGIPFKPVYGQWNGTSEVAFIVPANFRRTTAEPIEYVRRVVESLCSRFAQECYLEIDRDRRAYQLTRVRASWIEKPIGQWRAITDTDRQRLIDEGESYTYDPETGISYRAD